MRNETKIAIAVRDDLAPWQKLNVTAFLSSGLVGAYPELRGEAYRDRSGRVYGPPVRQPILIFAASGEDLTRALSRARERGLRCWIYTHNLLSIGNDADNRAAVQAVATEALDLVGLALHAERKEVDKVSKGLRLHL
jgi:hypothetical protein